MTEVKVDRLVLGTVATNAYIVSFGGKCIVIDPADEADKISAFIDERGLTPLAVLVTHGHFDHMMAARGVADKYGIKIYAGEGDRNLFENPEMNVSVLFTGKAFTLAPDIYVKGGETLDFDGLNLKAIDTPGHTVGSMSFYADDVETDGKEVKIIFSGDVIFSGSIGRCDFPTGSERDMKRTLNTIIKSLPKKTLIFPGHGPATTVENELLSNPYLL